MVNKLAKKNLVLYKKYNGASLTPTGKSEALKVIRRHRLWEVFLVEKLNFNWDEVHEIAEQMEHINSPLLIKRIDKFLNYPKYDPHGDPIPTADGEIPKPSHSLLSETSSNSVRVTGVKNSSDTFLKHLNKLKISLGSEILIIDKIDFDNSFEIEVNSEKIIISKEVSQNIYVEIK